jgi:hypothetical protein
MNLRGTLTNYLSQKYLFCANMCKVLFWVLRVDWWNQISKNSCPCEYYM